MKRLITLSLALLMVLSLFPLSLSAQAAETASGYYYNQLTTAEARGIYGTLAELRDAGKLKTGTHTVDLVKKGVLENRSYSKDALMADFIAGRDAFMLDNAALFYVDFDKLTISQSQAGSNYVITMGVGRDSTYFRTGFDSSNVDAAVTAFNREVSTIASVASAKEDIKDKVRAAYDAVMEKVRYALEKDASEGNVNYVRTPYGALVRGESVCEGYARALKAVLDALGIENVLVQGYYSETIAGVLQGGPHMWNYVKMDDNRWYLVDATMGDGEGIDANDYFLKSGADTGILKPYQPDGTISLSSLSTEFRYPNLSAYGYEGLKSNAFTLLDGGAENESYISYKGMGVAKAKEQGKYILASSDGELWRYFDYAMMFLAMAYGEVEYDFDEYFINNTYYGYAFFAVTDQPHPAPFDHKDSTTFNYRGPVSDMIQVGEITEMEKVAPVVVTRTPANSRLDGGKTYQATATFSEKLRLGNSALEAGIEWVTPIEGAELTDFQWEKGSNTVSFTFTTVNTYAYSTGYYFRLTNLIGEESLKTPNPVGYTVVNNPSFACPKIAGDINEIYANTPALIDDSNLADNDWKDEAGNPIANYASNRLALVASNIQDAEADQMIEEIEKTEGAESVLAAQTFDISLTLCSGQVSYITGNRVKVFVPFPAGYTASNASFKAYHFKADGTAEEIDCVATEKGIIMMCEAFSPFAVVALEKEEVAEKTVITYADGNGSFGDEELVKVGKGETKTVTVTAEEGYRIEDVKLNGSSVLNRKAKTSGDTTTITLDYDALQDSGNTLEATFTLKNVEVADAETLTITTSAPADVTITAPEDGWKEGMNSFTVSSTVPCIVAVTHDNGSSYTRLTAVSAGVENTWSFSASLTADSQIAVVLVGDANGDGALSTADNVRIAAAILNKTILTSLETLAADVNQSGTITTADDVKLTAMILNKTQIGW